MEYYENRDLGSLNRRGTKLGQKLSENLQS